MVRKVVSWLIVVALASLVALVFIGRPDTSDLLPTPVKDQLILWQGKLTMPQFDTADYTPMAHTDVNPFGINTFFEQEAEEWKIRKSMEMIRAAGFRWIRQQFTWNHIEPSKKGDYWDYKNNRSAWSQFDLIVDLAQEYGLEIVARLDWPPPWARKDRAYAYGPPDTLQDYGDFVYAVVSRYKGKVRYYQIWNEPNLTIEWGQQPIDPAAYVEMLKVAYTRAKEADPNSVIIAAALAPTVEQGPLNLSDLDFLRRMYELGAKDYFDIASFNPYGLWWGPDDYRLAPDRTNYSRPLLARQVMVEYGDASKPIWASELGWPAVPQDWPDPITHGQVTREQQATYTVRAYQRALEEWPWMGPMFLWHFRMVTKELTNQQAYYFNIVDDQFQPYPAYYQLEKLANSSDVLYPGYRQESHWALKYEGNWQEMKSPKASLGSYKLATTVGNKVAFRFVGRDLTLVLGKGPSGGSVEVTIDGKASLANRVPKVDGKALVDLYAEKEQWQAAIPVAQGLPYGEHLAEISVVQTRNAASKGSETALDGIIVRGPAKTPWIPIAAWMVTIVGVVGGWLLGQRMLR